MDFESARKARKAADELAKKASVELTTPKEAIRRGKSSATLPSSASSQSLSLSSASASSSKPGFKDDHTSNLFQTLIPTN